MAEMVTSWLYRQFEKVAQKRPDLVELVLQRAMCENESFRWAVVIGAYLDEQINLGKAAELLEMHPIQLQRQFLEKGIPLRIGPQTIEEAKAEVELFCPSVKHS